MSNETLGRLSSEWNGCIVDVEQRGYVYSLSLMIDTVLRNSTLMTEEEALEWINYHIIAFILDEGAVFSPIIIDDYNHELKDLVFIGEE